MRTDTSVTTISAPTVTSLPERPARLPPGLVIAAPASGSGKTTFTLGLLRALRARGVSVGSLKVGPDYIDPAYHSAAGGRPCFNLDLWAMRTATQDAALEFAARDAQLLVAEGVMGLFDGARIAPGVTEAATADAAARLGWTVILVVDASGMAGSAAALVSGFARYRDDVRIGGIVFNRVGGQRHADLLREACAPLGIPVFGCLGRDAALALPDRHLGLVQAVEHPELEAFLNQAAAAVSDSVDIDGLLCAAAGGTDRLAHADEEAVGAPVPPLGQRIAVAQDAAFGFAYEQWLIAWRRLGAEVLPFSPLASQGPDPSADAVFLPGGYPELHAGRLAACDAFIKGLRDAASKGSFVYGECGGYMVLGNSLVDADGAAHAMAGLLPVSTSFAEPKLTLGYREVGLASSSVLGRAGTRFRGHEFHFARVIHEPGVETTGRPAFSDCLTAAGDGLGPTGSARGNVVGSFVHLVDLRC